MSAADMQSEPDTGGLTPSQGSPLHAALSPAQRKALAHLCRIHERGISPRRFSRRTSLLALYIIFILALAVLALNMTAFAGPGYLFLGFVLGALLKDLRILMNFRRIWPVYEEIIDWPRAFHLLKANESSKAMEKVSGTV